MSINDMADAAEYMEVARSWADIEIERMRRGKE